MNHSNCLTIILAFLFIFSSCKTAIIDISPNNPNGANESRFSQAGLMIGIAGNSRVLYAVSPNAGIWKNSFNPNTSSFGRWQQLPESPRYANCIAIDPQNENHIVVGERIGDASFQYEKQGGIWESFDGGQTFPRQFYFDPFTSNAYIAGGENLVFNGIIFSRLNTILTATPGGVGRKVSNATTFDFSTSPVRGGNFTAITVFDNFIVTRVQNNIYISATDGIAWTSHSIPTSIGGYTILTDLARGDKHSIAAYKDPQRNKLFVYVPVKTAQDIGNKNSLLVYDVSADTWNLQILNSGDGTGLGGRRFVKSFDLTRTGNLPRTLGKAYQLVYCSGQEVMQAIGIENNGVPVWRSLAQTTWGGPYAYPPDNIHADLWDIRFDPAGLYTHLASDGGIFELSLLPVPFWKSLNDGLHTHHVHSVASSADSDHWLVAYATADNDAWILEDTSNNKWKNFGGLGDANWVASDHAYLYSVVAARHFMNATLFSGGIRSRITINNDSTTANVQGFQVIQTLKSEAIMPPPDVVMLVKLPLLYRENNVFKPVSGILGNPNPTGQLALIRSRHYLLNSDINRSKGVGWELMYNDLPEGTKAFWVSGGHSSPAVFLLSEVSGVRNVYKRNKASNFWMQLNVRNVNRLGQHGPVFLNPYDENMVFVSTDDGIYFSTNGGSSFSKDTVLTNLVLENGKYPAIGNFTGARESFLIQGMATHANVMCPLSCMTFNRERPSEMIASSPFTGIFHKIGNSPWRDLSKYLPRPYTPISSLGFYNSTVIIGTEGRGLLKLINF